MSAELTEGDLRRLAQLARRLLPRLVADPALAAQLDADLGAALALPEGEAKSPLRRLLTRSDSTLRRWLGERAGLGESDRAPADPRSLLVRSPLTVELGVSFGLHVRIGRSTTPGEAATPLDLGALPPEGIDLTVDVWSPGLAGEESSSMRLHVPQDGDSGMIRFGLRAVAVGAQSVHVMACRAGLCVAELVVVVDVMAASASPSTSAPAETGDTGRSAIDLRREDAGAYTLLVKRMPDERYNFALRGAESDEPGSVERVDGDTVRSIADLAAQLGDLAAKVAAGTTAGQLTKLRGHAISLWLDAIPEPIRAQFWTARPQMTSLTIVSDWARVPWELMYPSDDGQDEGFLVEGLPVVRHSPAAAAGRALSVTSAAFVVPPGSPRDAGDEVDRIRARVGASMYGGVFERYEELADLLSESPPAILHFACHNDFSDEAGSQILLAGGELFTPDDLGPSRAARSLRGSLVFLNACRSAAEFAGWRSTTGWADRFADAGASAFIGSLWSIRSSAASDFADAFYAALVEEHLPLGRAVHKARLQIRSSADADPTWLAYTVYGDPAAQVPAVSQAG